MARVLITGTSTGIGLAIAQELGRAGHRVYATMRNPAKAAPGLPATVLAMDVDSDRSVAECFAAVERDELPMEAFREIMETNCFGAIRYIRRFWGRCASAAAAASST